MLILFSSFFFFKVFQFADADLIYCNDLIPKDMFRNIYSINRQELTEACLGVLAYLECYADEIEENPEDFDDDNQLFHKNLRELVRDMCTNGSTIQNNYFASRDCFMSTKDIFDTCLESAELEYRQYASTFITDPENIEAVSDEKGCFPRGHAVGCMANEILKSCGALQQATYIELTQRSRYLGKFCQPSTAEALKTVYLEYLNLDENLKNMYRDIFEYEV